MKKEMKKKEISQQYKNLLAEYKDELKDFFNGTSFAKSIMKDDKEKFDKFKKGKLIFKYDYDYKNMYVLSLLENLGFPIDELGTYLYKEVIFEVGEQLSKLEESFSVEEYNNLFDSLNNFDSDLYLWVASDYLEMGKKTFLSFMKQSFDKIDDTKANEDISELLFGDEEQPDYAFQTVQLAKQTLAYDKYSKKSPKILSYLK